MATPGRSADESPTGSDVLGWVESLKNWGRWGVDDELGTLNLITPEVRKRGAALVTEGIAVPLAWELIPPSHDQHGLVQRYMMQSGEGADDPGADGAPPPRGRFPMEYVGFAFHGFAVTHLDSPPHVLWDGMAYNGFPARTVTTQWGAQHSGVQVAREGFSGRGILLDLGEFDEPVYPSHVEEIQQRQGVAVEPGDMVLLRVGISARRKAGQRAPARTGGWHAAMMPWLHERDVALIGSDAAQDALPHEYPEIRSPVHVIGLYSMGLWLLDNCDLEELAETCRRLGRWEFQLSLQPLPIRGGTGSPVAPIAMF